MVGTCWLLLLSTAVDARGIISTCVPTVSADPQGGPADGHGGQDFQGQRQVLRRRPEGDERSDSSQVRLLSIPIKAVLTLGPLFLMPLASRQKFKFRLG